MLQYVTLKILQSGLKQIAAYGEANKKDQEFIDSIEIYLGSMLKVKLLLELTTSLLSYYIWSYSYFVIQTAT